jgi:hypothetical protein
MIFSLKILFVPHKYPDIDRHNVAIKVQSCNGSLLTGVKSKIFNFGCRGVVSVQCLKWGRMPSWVICIRVCKVRYYTA